MRLYNSTLFGTNAASWRSENQRRCSMSSGEQAALRDETGLAPVEELLAEHHEVTRAGVRQAFVRCNPQPSTKHECTRLLWQPLAPRRAVLEEHLIKPALGREHPFAHPIQELPARLAARRGH